MIGSLNIADIVTARFPEQKPQGREQERLSSSNY